MRGNDGFWNVLTADMDIGKKKEEERPFNVGISSIMFATLCNVFWANPLIVGFFYLAGFGLIVLDFVDMNDKTKELIRNLDIKNKDGKYALRLSKQKKIYGYDLRFSVPSGLDIEDFSKHARAWETALKHRVTFIYDSDYNVVVRIYEKDLKKKYPFKLLPVDHILKIPIGCTFGDVPVLLDLLQAPHVLIAGMTGAGKSFIVRVIITTLLLRQNVKLHLCDLKGGVELDEFKDYEPVVAFSTEIREVERDMTALIQLMKDREKLFREAKVKKIEEYNSKFPNKKLDWHILVIDELADFIDQRNAQNLLDELARLGRFAGIRLIGACQKPDADTLKTRTRNNFPTKIGLTVTKNNDSLVICDDTILTQLKGRGHAILFDKGEQVEFRGFFLEDSKELLKDVPQREEVEAEPEEEDDSVDNFDFLGED